MRGPVDSGAGAWCSGPVQQVKKEASSTTHLLEAEAGDELELPVRHQVAEDASNERDVHGEVFL